LGEAQLLRSKLHDTVAIEEDTMYILDAKDGLTRPDCVAPHGHRLHMFGDACFVASAPAMWWHVITPT
jgi:hypothetical protein